MMNNDPYNFAETTILINCQILPQTESEDRTVLITVGIKNEVPLGQTVTLSQLQLPSIITAMLAELQQQLSIKKEAYLQQQEQAKQESLKTNYQRREVQTPTIYSQPNTNLNSLNNKQQLALF